MQREIAIIFCAIVGITLLFLWGRYIASRIKSAYFEKKPNFVYYSTIGGLIMGTLFSYMLCLFILDIDLSNLTTLFIDGEFNIDIMIILPAFFTAFFTIPQLVYKVKLRDGIITYRTLKGTITFPISDITEVKGYLGWARFYRRFIEIPLQNNVFYSGEKKLMALGSNSSAYSKLESLLKREGRVAFTGEEAPLAVSFPNGTNDPKLYYLMDLVKEDKVLELFNYCKVGRGHISEDGWYTILILGHKTLYELNEKADWLKCSTMAEYEKRLEEYRRENADKYCFDNLKKL